MGKSDYDVQSAIAVVKGGGNMVSDRKIYVKAIQLQSGEPAAVGVGIKSWGAIDYLRNHGYGIVFETQQTKKQADNNYA